MYGLCLLAGILSSALLGERLIRLLKLDFQVYWKAIFYALVFGIFGARFYHVLHHSGYYFQHPVEILWVWQGGLGIWGGILGALTGVFISVRKSPGWISYLDIFAVCAPLAQAIGRWGNFFNREIFGYPTNLPWGIYIPLELRPPLFRYFEYFHPLFLYESLLNIVLFIFLYRTFIRARTKKLNVKPGTFVILYVSGYSLIRFFLEFMRIDAWKFGSIPVASLVSFFALAIAWWLWRLLNKSV